MDSIYKLIDYVAKVSKQAIYLDGRCILTEPVSSVALSPKFFIKDNCEMCGRCCPNENTAYTKTCFELVQAVEKCDFDIWGLNYTDKLLLIERIEEKIININGNEVTFYSHPKDNKENCNRINYPDRPNLERCHWVFEMEGTYRCKIHPARSITCGMPHLRFFYNSKTNRTGLGVSQFGRNWALGCPAKFGDIDEESIQGRIKWLQLLDIAAKDMGIETFLPEILDYLASGRREPKQFNLKERRKLF